MTGPYFAGLTAFGIHSPMLELQQEVEAAIQVARAVGLSDDEGHEVIREMDAVYRELPTAFSWEVVRERMIARSMGLPWRQSDVESARLAHALFAPPPSPEREEKETDRG